MPQDSGRPAATMTDKSFPDQSRTTPDDGALPSRTDTRDLIGSVLADRYELYSLLGKGGMGIVMAARDRALRTNVAIKVLRPELATDRRWAERLGREVKVARQIHHPNVCPVFDLERADGQVFIVMPLALGPLQAELSGEGPDRSFEDRLQDIGAIAAGLAAIHEAGIVHRDLSVHNVLRMKTGQLAVSDFGLAIEAERTVASIEGGTVAYMAPELTLGGRASFASDLWAAGIIIHEIMFGRRPVWRDDVVRNGISRHVGHLTDIDEKVLSICRRCTAEQPALRGTAAMLADAIALVRSRPLTRHRPRRRRWMLAVAGAAVVGALGLLRVHKRPSGTDTATTSSGADVLKLEGEPEEWTGSAPVVAEVPGRVQCMRLLPDGHTLRFVWGSDPRVAQDVDVRTKTMIRSPIEPRTYRYGCPSLSPDGRHLLFEDYDSHGRAAIYSSDHPDGSGASVVAMTDDMRGGSEATWFAAGTAVIMDVDRQHAGIMELSSNHMTVVPRDAYGDGGITGWTAGGDLAILIKILAHGDAYLDGYRWPSMTKAFHVRASIATSDVATYDGSTIYLNDLQRAIVALRPRERTMTRVGAVPGQFIGYLAPGPAGLGFVSFALSCDLYLAQEGGLRPVTSDGRTWEAARCGPHGFLLATRTAGYQSMTITRLDEHGVASVVATGGLFSNPVCDRTGQVWWYGHEQSGVFEFVRCTIDGCSTLRRSILFAAHLSPDETRLVFLVFGPDGEHVQWMPAAGGTAHDVVASETGCAPGWASNDTLWVSRKHQDAFYWAEVDATAGTETGRRLPTSHDCSDTDPDPLSPVDPDMRVIPKRVSQIRWKETRPLGKHDHAR